MNKDAGKFLIGIDSGGTKCEVLITSEQTHPIFSKSYEGVHYSVVGGEKYSAVVSGYINDLLKKSKLTLSNCIGICIGVAGAREKEDRLTLDKLFRKKLKCSNILITTDAMTALYGAFEGEEGIILISGTGSVLYGYCDEEITRVGGWGRIIGDEGSGYWIGKRALNLVAKEYDKEKIIGNRSLLSSELAQKFGLTRFNINQTVFKKDFQIQSIAPVVADCAGKGCPVSLQIVDEAVDGLLYHIKTFLKVTNRKKEIMLSFIGSVIENENIISKKLRKEIKKLKIVKVVQKKNTSSFGSVLLAYRDSSLTKKLK